MATTVVGQRKKKYLTVGDIFAKAEAYEIVTVLGSCVSVCLWDNRLKIGGMNHYMLPLWNGEGLASPKYGSIAINKLIQRMIAFGSRKEHLIAKVFGGASVITNNNKGLWNVGERNVIVAQDMLEDDGIPVVSADTGGILGRKILFDTLTGRVLVKKLRPIVKDYNS